jgi:hypothetical protein
MNGREDEEKETVEWPEPADEPEEEQAETLENDGTPGAAPPRDE